MANFEFNIAKGKTGYYAGLPAASDVLVLVLLQASGLEGDATLVDYGTLAAVLAGSSEADFTNYARVTLTSVSATVDNGNDRLDVDCDDIVITSAGGVTNNMLGKAIVCYDPGGGSDSDLIPLTGHDLTVTTDGSDLTIAPPSGGFFRAE